MIELQDIFHKFGKHYRNTNSLNVDTLKAMNSIENCRTAKMNGHMDVCLDCGSFRIAYNSCKNSNCPKCGNLKKEQWILDRKAEMLPVPHSHTVFTVPDSLQSAFPI